jgi:hypothetical protein
MHSSGFSTWRVTSILAVIGFLLCLAAESFYCFERPMVTLDTFAYVSIVDRTGPEGFGDVASRCLTELHGEHTLCGPLATPKVVRQFASYSVEDFQTFLRFYRVKPLYTFVVGEIHDRLHVSAYTALRLVSSLSFGLMGLVVWWWLAEYLSPEAASLTTILLMSVLQVQNLGKFLLPDAFSAALLLLGTYLLIYSKRVWPGLLVLFLLPMARPDNIFYVMFLLLALVWRAELPQQRKLGTMLAVCVGCAAYSLVLQRATHTLPYPILFAHSFGDAGDPSSFADVHFSFKQYLRVLAVSGGKTLLIELPAPLLLATLAIANDRGWSVLRDVVRAACAAVALRVVMFPAMEERYYTWLFVLSGVVVIASVGHSVREDSWFRASRKPRHKTAWFSTPVA